MRAHPSPGSDHATLATTGPGAGGLPRHLPRLAGHQHRQRRPADPAAGAGHRHGRSARARSAIVMGIGGCGCSAWPPSPWGRCCAPAPATCRRWWPGAWCRASPVRC
ncbi:hypothetical protein G6F40_016736 [Rhizopus arrhizus]|nr:hypothetical protein G6F40_016736 [Rhizopus arrhizus]